jgi:hypothetical protein
MGLRRERGRTSGLFGARCTLETLDLSFQQVAAVSEPSHHLSETFYVSIRFCINQFFRNLAEIGKIVLGL